MDLNSVVREVRKCAISLSTVEWEIGELLNIPDVQRTHAASGEVFSLLNKLLALQSAIQKETR